MAYPIEISWAANSTEENDRSGIGTFSYDFGDSGGQVSIPFQEFAHFYHLSQIIESTHKHGKERGKKDIMDLIKHLYKPQGY